MEIRLPAETASARCLVQVREVGLFILRQAAEPDGLLLMPSGELVQGHDWVPGETAVTFGAWMVMSRCWPPSTLISLFTS